PDLLRTDAPCSAAEPPASRCRNSPPVRWVHQLSVLIRVSLPSPYLGSPRQICQQRLAGSGVTGGSIRPPSENYTWRAELGAVAPKHHWAQKAYADLAYRCPYIPLALMDEPYGCCAY